MIVDLTTGDRARPRDHERHVHAAFGKHAFLAVERIVERSVPAGAAAGCIQLVDLQRSAVVADVEDERLFGEAVFRQRAGDQPDAIIHRREHGECLSPPLGHLTGKTIEIFLRCIKRHVRGAIGDVQKNGLSL